MRENLYRFANSLNNLLLPVFVFLVPIFFLPLTADFFTPNKHFLIAIFASIALLSWCLQLLAAGKVRLTLSPATLPLILFALIHLASSLIQEPTNLPHALLGRSSLYVSLVIIFISLTSSAITPSTITSTLSALALSSVLASLSVIIQYFGFLSASGIDFLQNKSFNLVGGPLPYLTFALLLLPAFTYLSLRLPHRQKSLYFLALGLMIFASFIAVSEILPKDNQQFVILPLSTGWAIAIDLFKNLRTSLLGVGPENFASAFALLKPLSFNQSSFWTLRFSTSSNEYLTILTTTGVLALLLYLFSSLRSLGISFLKPTHKDTDLASTRLIFIVALVLQLILPANVIVLFLTFISLTLMTLSLKAKDQGVVDVIVSFFSFHYLRPTNEGFDRPHAKSIHLLPWIIAILSLGLIGSHAYWRTKAYAADHYFYQSLQAAAQNQGTQTYNLQIKTITSYPYEPSYRIAYSQTNLALANAIASKKDVTEQDRNNVTQLIQQAIREAKVATSLAPGNPAAWQNLASVYRQLINLAQGADQWTIAAYTQAITLDPLNPQLRVELGGVYFSLKNYDQAALLFQQAVAAKQDWANAHYNLASTYKEQKQLDKALEQMRIVVALLPATSSDLQKAQDELKELEGQVKTPTTSTTPGNELQKPVVLPSPSLKPIKLPEGSGPDATPSAR